METVTVNRAPAPTWNRLGLNDITVRLPELPDTPALISGLPAGVTLHRLDRVCDGDRATALGAEVCGLSDGGISISGNSDDAAHLGLAYTGNAAETVLLRAEKGARLNVIMYVTAENAASLRTFAEVGENASIRLVQVFEGGENSLFLNDTGAQVADSGKFDITQIFLGGALTVTGVNAELDGYRSEIDCKLGYLLGGTEKLDINNIVLHKGKKSRSDTKVTGVLSGNSEKLFRGTIDFKNGASGSVGAETEDVLLMNEKVVNKTVPVILCAEEDVEGSHGASIGRLADDVLYYMTARGIPLEKAYELMAASRLENLIRSIGDEKTAERALAALDRRSGYAAL